MKIDAVQHVKNKISVSYLDTGSAKLNDLTFSVFPTNDTIAWEITDVNRNGNQEWIIVEFDEPISIYDVKLDVTAGSTSPYKIYSSLDTKIFNEYEYMTYTVGDLSGIPPYTAELLTTYQDYVIHIQTIPKTYAAGSYMQVGNDYGFYDELGNLIMADTTHYISFAATEAGLLVLNKLYTILEKDTTTPVLLSDEDMMLMKDFIEGERITPSKLSMKYKFTYTDRYLNTEKYFIDKKNKAIKIVFENVTTPFTLNTLNIYANVSIDVVDNTMNYISSALFQPKYFQDYTFLPSMVNSYFDMLTEKG